MFSSLLIHRPNFAIVIAVVVTLAGLLALSTIPVTQYPDITPPQVTVSASYPGAGAGARVSIGATVFGGMVLASFIGVLFVPALFVAFGLLRGAAQRRIRGTCRQPAE